MSKDPVYKNLDFFIFVLMTNEFIKGVKQLLDTPRRIVLIPHFNPDGDAMGSSIALQMYFTKLGHDAVVVVPNDCPEILLWMPGMKNVLNYYHHGHQVIHRIIHADVIIALDLNTLERTEKLAPLIQRSKAKIIMIDHHNDPENFADWTYSNPNESSTCEMVYKLMEIIDKKLIDQDIATCLYTGILTDTGSFAYSSTSANTHFIAHKLLGSGINIGEIHQKIYNQHTLGRVQLLGKALSTLHRVNNLPVVYIHLTQNDLNAFGYKKGDTNGFVNYGLTIEDVELSVFFIEDAKSKKIKISFRSKNYFSTQDFASKNFNGGGHFHASGGYFEGTMENAITYFEKCIGQNASEFS
ncbi:MAG: bifunctional oligoribonuclease/PAP phosphatase NrnA [Flavobacteriaceae bacterium]|nr:bifunctional oligoribonuclease/PAP phosphatase NrnA [Flavobacteriaceae bacterium]MCY4253357.1 bifunctional oligoribonuclease/PAP phosphatase NrnA [Flavobacteriaceae bacterium]